MKPKYRKKRNIRLTFLMYHKTTYFNLISEDVVTTIISLFLQQEVI